MKIDQSDPHLTVTERRFLEAYHPGEPIAVCGARLGLSVGMSGYHARNIETKLSRSIFHQALRGRPRRSLCDDFDVKAGERCKCGLLLPCDDCVGRAEDYMSTGDSNLGDARRFAIGYEGE